MDTTQSFMIIRAFKIFFQVTGPKTTLSMLAILRENLLPSGGVRPLVHATSDVKALMACIAQVRPKETLQTFLPHALKILLQEQCSNSMKLWCWSIVGGVLQNCGRDVLSYREDLKRAFRDVFDSKDIDKSVRGEREARELTFSCFHQNITCVTSIICITHLYHKKITRTRNAQIHTQILRTLNSRCALEHRYTKKPERHCAFSFARS